MTLILLIGDDSFEYTLRDEHPEDFDYGMLKGIPRSVLPFAPDTVTWEDLPRFQPGKPHPVPLSEEMLDYSDDINSEAGAVWNRSVGNARINLPYNTGETPRMEPILFGGDIVRWRSWEKSNNFVKLDFFNWTDKPETFMHPLTHNWYTMPYKFSAARAIDNTGKVIKIANGIDAFMPDVAYTEAWMSLDKIEVFPHDLYHFWGLNIYSEAGPLMTVAKSGIRTFPRPEKFFIESKSSPVPFNWS